MKPAQASSPRPVAAMPALIRQITTARSNERIHGSLPEALAAPATMQVFKEEIRRALPK